MICSAIGSGCGIPRPDTDLCGVNAQAGHRKCYNIKDDYTDEGKIKPNAKPKFKPAQSISELDKNICVDPDGFANLKAYIRELRERVKCDSN